MNLLYIILLGVIIYLLWHISPGEGEKFEYLIHNLGMPKNKDFEALDYDSKEYKKLEWHKEYASMLLNELGLMGWELISSSNNTFQKGETVERIIFKRNSKNHNFGTGFGVNVIALGELARKQAEENHPTLDI